VGFRAAYNRARGKKLGVPAHKLAGGESPVDGNFNHGPEGIFLAHPKCIPGQPKPYVVEVKITSRL
jgi:hypothetical protein